MTAIDIPQDLSGITPVGMTAQAGVAGAVIAELAEQQRALAGWQAFHYEQINPQQFEVTGGVLDPSLSGMRKFSGPHDSVVLDSSAILSALQARLLSDQPAPAVTPPGMNATAQPQPASLPGASLAASFPYLQISLALPTDAAARARVLARLATGQEFEGASVLASALLSDYPTISSR